MESIPNVVVFDIELMLINMQILCENEDNSTVKLSGTGHAATFCCEGQRINRIYFVHVLKLLRHPLYKVQNILYCVKIACIILISTSANFGLFIEEWSWMRFSFCDSCKCHIYSNNSKMVGQQATLWPNMYTVVLPCL